MVHQNLECGLLWPPWCIRICCEQQMIDMEGIVRWFHRCRSLHCCCYYRWFAHCCCLCQLAHCCWCRKLCTNDASVAIVALCNTWLGRLTYRIESTKYDANPGRHGSHPYCSQSNSMPSDQVTRQASLCNSVHASTMARTLLENIYFQSSLSQQSSHCTVCSKPMTNPQHLASYALWHGVCLQRLHTVKPCQRMSGQWTCLWWHWCRRWSSGLVLVCLWPILVVISTGCSLLHWSPLPKQDQNRNTCEAQEKTKVVVTQKN